MKFTVTLFGILLICVISLNAQEAKKEIPGNFTLKEAMDFAVQNSYTALNAQRDVELAKKKKWEITAIGLPQVSAKANYQNIFKVPELQMATLIPVFNYDSLNPIYDYGDIFSHKHEMNTATIPLGVKENITLDLTVTQLLFSGEYLLGLKAQKQLMELTQQTLAKTENDIRFSIAKTYYIILVLEESKKILDSSYSLVTKTAGEMLAMNSQGFVEETEVDQIKLTAVMLKNTITNIEHQTETVKRLLKFQMGIDVSHQITLTDKLESCLAMVSLSEVYSDSIDVSSVVDYQLLETAVTLAKTNVKWKQTKYLPTLVGVYRHQEMKDKPAFNFNPPDVLAVSLDIPIFSSGGKHAAVQQAKIELEKTKTNQEQVAQGLSLEYQQAKSDFTNAVNKYNATKESYDLAKKIFDKSLLKFREGVGSSMDITLAQKQFLTAQSDYFTAVSEILNAKAKLDKLMSKL